MNIKEKLFASVDVIRSFLVKTMFFLIWMFGIGFAYVCILGVISNVPSVRTLQDAAISSVTLLAFLAYYIFFVIISCHFLSKSIRKLLDPGGDDTEIKESASFMAFVAAILVTFILAILAFNYHAHMAKAERTLAEAAQAELVASIGVVASTEAPKVAIFGAPQEPFFGKKLGPASKVEKIGGFLGTFGDFFGGFFNPILAFFTFGAIAINILMQRKQLRLMAVQVAEAKAQAIVLQKEAEDSRRHAQTQAFETTFFNMLSLHAENVSSLSYDPNCVSVNPLADISPEVNGLAVFIEVLRSPKKSPGNTQLEMYRRIQNEHNDVLGRYFRHLYQIIALVDGFSVDGKRVGKDVRKRYTNIIRAQLSSSELAVLLLNCTDGMVDDGAFKKLIIRYKFLEHLPVEIKSGRFLNPDGLLTGPSSLELFDQYFSKNTDADPYPPFKAGAFGKNKAIAQFLSAKYPQCTT